MTKQTVHDVDLKGKRVLVRAALNVPIADGKVQDPFRIQSAIPTLEYILGQGASIILLSHHSHEGTSLAPVAPILEKLLDRPVQFIPDALSPEAKTAAAELQPGQVILLENLRFHPGEEANNAEFAKSLAELGDVYVDDDFTTLHRAHASIVGIPKHLPAVAGLLVEKEVDTITGALEHPKRPLVAVIGGAKVSSKIEVLDSLLKRVNALFIGGAMANTFLAADGQTMGRSMYEPDLLKKAQEIKETAAERKIDLVLPSDLIISSSIEKAEDVRTVPPAHVTAEDYIVDVGHQFADELALELRNGGTVIWNGPVGLFEIPQFAAGTHAIAEAIIKSGAESVVGGGDTASFVDGAKLHDKFTWVSTGGGASLDLIAGKELPGLAALRDK